MERHEKKVKVVGENNDVNITQRRGKCLQLMR